MQRTAMEQVGESAFNPETAANLSRCVSIRIAYQRKASCLEKRNGRCA